MHSVCPQVDSLKFAAGGNSRSEQTDFAESLSAAQQFMKMVAHPFEDWIQLQFTWMTSVLEMHKAMAHFASLGASTKDRVARDSNRVSFDLLMKAFLNLSKAAVAATQEKDEWHPGPFPREACKLGDVGPAKDIFVIDMAACVAKVEREIQRCPLITEACNCHLADLCNECEQAVSKAEEVGEGYEECHTGSCWKESMKEDMDLDKVLAQAANTLSTLDPKAMGTALSKLNKARFNFHRFAISKSLSQCLRLCSEV